MRFSLSVDVVAVFDFRLFLIVFRGVPLDSCVQFSERNEC